MQSLSVSPCACAVGASAGSFLQPVALLPCRCHQMDDFAPAKSLMTMCFTYYYIGEPPGGGAGTRQPASGGVSSPLKAKLRGLIGRGPW